MHAQTHACHPHALQSGSNEYNLTLRSTSNPNDPLGFKLASLGGSLMPHRFCSSSGLGDGPLLASNQVRARVCARVLCGHEQTKLFHGYKAGRTSTVAI